MKWNDRPGIGPDKSFWAAKVSGKEERMNRLKGIKEFLTEEEGMGTVEIILIIVVLVGLVIIFKNQITQVINTLFQKITNQTGGI